MSDRRDSMSSINTSGSRAAAPDSQARLRSIVDDTYRLVARTLRKNGVRNSELDDEVQRTYIVVSNRLADVEQGSERSFVRQVAHNRASHARRSYGRRREILSDTVPETTESPGTPEEMAARKQMCAVLDAAVAGMDESLRSTFVLHEVEEMNLSEIAALLRIPRGTVASRLRRARAFLRNDPAAIELAGDLGTKIAQSIEDPALLRRRKGTRLQRALLRIGTKMRESASLRARTLAACRAMGLG
jgi:RNA polymerase sigma-70 factor (ECF subfamily)